MAGATVADATARQRAHGPPDNTTRDRSQLNRNVDVGTAPMLINSKHITQVHSNFAARIDAIASRNENGQDGSSERPLASEPNSLLSSVNYDKTVFYTDSRSPSGGFTRAQRLRMGLRTGGSAVRCAGASDSSERQHSDSRAVGRSPPRGGSGAGAGAGGAVFLRHGSERDDGDGDGDVE
ncbi:hypothetical protein EVAR_38906_1 [Eumeta japonica]|uniref:Uncharacterized protein n=1 Tax=Eumeta variegata TaxID=151549 RepID=A0A4C1ZQ27_EUMVA|nr:hypothetical protein EVAR_38906_1 [Eumeta japonica]